MKNSLQWKLLYQWILKIKKQEVDAVQAYVTNQWRHVCKIFCHICDFKKLIRIFLELRQISKEINAFNIYKLQLS